MAELKPCPFCGRVPSKVKKLEPPTFYKTHYYVGCKAPNSKCSLKPRTRLFDTEEQAIESWNRRADNG